MRTFVLLGLAAVFAEQTKEDWEWEFFDWRPADFQFPKLVRPQAAGHAF